MAMLQVTDDGGSIYTPLEGREQIHARDTWVLALDLSDTITRCKKSGALHDAAVRTQITLTRTHRGTPKDTRRPREDTLGEPAQEADGERTYYGHTTDILHSTLYHMTIMMTTMMIMTMMIMTMMMMTMMMMIWVWSSGPGQSTGTILQRHRLRKLYTLAHFP